MFQDILPFVAFLLDFGKLTCFGFEVLFRGFAANETPPVVGLTHSYVEK
jgi:hypothetical protein